MGIRELIASLFESSPDIRYAAVFSSDGVKLEGGMRTGLKSLEPENEASDIERQTVLYCVRLVSLEKYLGKTEFVFARTTNVDVMAISLNQNTILQVASQRLGELKLLDLVRKVLKA